MASKNVHITLEVSTRVKLDQLRALMGGLTVSEVVAKLIEDSHQEYKDVPQEELAELIRM